MTRAEVPERPAATGSSGNGSAEAGLEARRGQVVSRPQAAPYASRLYRENISLGYGGLLELNSAVPRDCHTQIRIAGSSPRKLNG